GMPDPFQCNIEDDLVCIIYGLGTTNTDYYMTGSGTFLTISGTVSETAASGTKSDLEIVAVDRTTTPTSTAVNEDIIFGYLGSDEEAPVIYDPTITNGYVEVTGDDTTDNTEDTSIDFGEVSKLGDVNVDGLVNSTDIVVLNKYLISASKYQLSSATAYANADCDMDKSLTSKDSMAIVNHILEVTLLD
ncbi:MAG: dockerin type I repeat-containing protein, partial [Oscillospiraceae bacterium]|nr:dockerin type I repeat-containing protein [Oscillospiraceae bacterium]